MSQFIKKAKSLAAFVVGMLVLGVHADTFLNNLAADVRVVDSSPYATGGDIILQLGENEYVHVFTNTVATQTFTALQMLNTRILLIGGGGAGGGTAYYGSGGGGAGGMLEVDSFIMAADSSYSLLVGAGCKTIQNNGGLLNNGEDTVMSSSATVLYRAFGGGGGAGANAAAKGGSGGGGATSMSKPTGADGESGQGNEGGTSESGKLWGGSGGGGAGGEGGAFDGSSGSGYGGAGKMSDILGFEQHFAGGGAGAKGVGGIGGGGNGASGSAKAAGNNGEDGLGGGGAGGAGGGGMGTGGDGLVAIRYLYTAASTTHPEVEASVAAADIHVASFDITVALSSTGSQPTADLTVVYGYAPDELTLSRPLATEVAAGAYRLSFAAEPGRTYYLKVVADNHADELNTAETEVFSVTAGNPFGDVSLVTARGKWSMASSLSALGVGENVVCLAIASSEKGEYVPVENSAVTVTAAGDLEVDANMLQAGYTFDGKTCYAKLMHVYAPVDGGAEVTNWSAFATGVLKDSGSFTLVLPGLWTDATTWSGPEVSEYGTVYPGYGATVQIAADIRGAVEVPGVVYVSYGFFNSGARHEVTFKGVGEGALINLAPSSVFDFFTATNVFDNVELSIRTENGFANNRLGQYFGVINGATVRCYPRFSHLDTVVDIANGGYLYFDQAVAAETTGSISFKGAAPTVEFKQNFTAANGGTPFLFAIPAEGYETAPVVANTKFPAGGKVIVNLPTKYRFALRTGSLGECDIPLIRSTVGLDHTKIEFGNNPLPGPCGFHYSDDGKTLYYHYKPQRGLAVIVR